MLIIRLDWTFRGNGRDTPYPMLGSIDAFNKTLTVPNIVEFKASPKLIVDERKRRLR